jgi:hypothetical protein
MSRNRLRKSVIAAALGAGLMAAQIAGAQSSPGAEPAPAGAPNGSDTRAIPGAQGPAPRTGDERPLLRQPRDRSMHQGGAPKAADTRPMPRDDVRAPRNGITRSDRERSGAYTKPHTGAGLGSVEMRPDGPDAGVAKSGVKP